MQKDCLTVNLPEARGLSPGHRRPLSESQTSSVPRVSQAQSRDGTSAWASTLPRPAPSQPAQTSLQNHGERDHCPESCSGGQEG